MSIETKNIVLPVCLEVPKVINAARTTEGFEYQPPEAQQAIIQFSSACLNFVVSPDDGNKNEARLALANLYQSNANKRIALEAALTTIRNYFNQNK